jgi:hypothetical protein
LGRRRLKGSVSCAASPVVTTPCTDPTDGGNSALAQIVQNAAGVVLEGRAISAAASRMRHDKFAGLEGYAMARRAITPALLGLIERAAARPSRF